MSYCSRCFLRFGVHFCVTQGHRNFSYKTFAGSLCTAGLAIAMVSGALGCSSSSATAGKTGKRGRGVAIVPEAIAIAVELKKIHRGLSKPLGLEYFVNDPEKRLFVVQQTGTIVAITNGKVQKEALLDLRGRISSQHSEQGLLGLAFHPQFRANGRLFVNYTDRDGATLISEFRASRGRLAKADVKSERKLLVVPQPWGNHNGGYLEFGPDGKLYVGMGDGGSGGDPKRTSQNPKSRLGKMLRIDVDTMKVEQIQKGLRNPWRFSFDAKTGDLYIADVGQNKWEEINVIAADSIVGANLGWSTMEGKHCFRNKGCTARGLTLPVVEYSHETGCSVTGGIVYRGQAIPALDGLYFYSDYCTAILRSFRWNKAGLTEHWNWKEALDPRYRLANVSAFAADEEGELYVLSSDGVIYKLLPRDSE